MDTAETVLIVLLVLAGVAVIAYSGLAPRKRQQDLSPKERAPETEPTKTSQSPTPDA